MDVQIPFPDHISHPIDDVNITKILAITTIGGRLIHYVQLEGGKKTLMPSTLTNVLVPQLVIEFYQNKLFFVNIYNQRKRPLRKNVRRHARKSTTPALKSKLLPTNNNNNNINNNSNSANTANGVNGNQNNHGNITKSDPPPSKPKSIMFSLASSLAKSFDQRIGKPLIQPKLPQATPVPVSVPIPAPVPQITRTKPKPLSKQLQHQQSNKKPSNS